MITGQIRSEKTESIGPHINSALQLKNGTITKLLTTISPVISQFLENCDGGFHEKYKVTRKD